MGWFDNLIDWGAEAVGYVDEYEDYTDQVLTAGQQLKDDFGFIKQGAKAYGMLSGTIGADGKRIKGKQQVFQQTKFARQGARSLGQVKSAISGGGGTPQFNVSQGSTMAVGANNPNIQTALAALMNSSYNAQMNNAISQFAISPNLGQGRKTSTGSTTLARKAKTRTA